MLEDSPNPHTKEVKAGKLQPQRSRIKVTRQVFAVYANRKTLFTNWYDNVLSWEINKAHFHQ